MELYSNKRRIYIVNVFRTMSDHLEEKLPKNVPTRWSALVITVLMYNLKNKLESMLIPRSGSTRNVLEEIHHLINIG